MSDQIPDGLSSDLSQLGRRLAELRKERGWKLEDVAKRTNLSRPYLSRLEGGERQPSLAALFALARAYGVTLSSLFESEPEAGGVNVVRGAEGPMQRGNGLLYTPLSRGSWSFNLQPLRVVVPADRGPGKIYQHEGEQWLYVLSGRLSLKIQDEDFVLEPGDAAHFEADSPHELLALGGEDAEVVLVACAVPYLLLRSYL
jgi:transcriptional regulator with XRE-family HTH domain